MAETSSSFTPPIGYRKPRAKITEQPDGDVLIELDIPSLEKSNVPRVPKQGTADVTFHNKGMSFVMTAKVPAKKEGVFKTQSGEERDYYLRVKQLPSKICTRNSSWAVEKGKIVIKFRKVDPNIKWRNLL
ncbi:uncharacterized protein LOC101855980 [Aplysia californica]|uniref:Uncharacterized protein LOC101855980 n=1 Tax=Aplysia californica TaxID=6500 RepID=A0ABM1W1M3_APLCA|nr:uncharacterized protein LOC101855980 [Aplysia californica]